MTPNRILEEDELGSPVSPETPGTRPAVGKAPAAISRHRVLLGSLGIVVVAVLAWRWTVRGESTPVAPSAGLNATSGPARPLEITVLGVHDAVAAAAPAAPPQPSVVAPPPAAAPAPDSPPSLTAPASPPSAMAPDSRPSATVSSPSRSTVAPRSSPARAQSSSAAKASPHPVTARSVPAEEPRVETAPAKPPPKPDAPPLETNPYVYK